MLKGCRIALHPIWSCCEENDGNNERKCLYKHFGNEERQCWISFRCNLFREYLSLNGEEQSNREYSRHYNISNWNKCSSLHTYKVYEQLKGRINLASGWPIIRNTVQENKPNNNYSKYRISNSSSKFHRISNKQSNLSR